MILYIVMQVGYMQLNSTNQNKRVVKQTYLGALAAMVFFFISTNPGTSQELTRNMQSLNGH